MGEWEGRGGLAGAALPLRLVPRDPDLARDDLLLPEVDPPHLPPARLLGTHTAALYEQQADRAPPVFRPPACVALAHARGAL